MKFVQNLRRIIALAVITAFVGTEWLSAQNPSESIWHIPFKLEVPEYNGGPPDTYQMRFPYVEIAPGANFTAFQAFNKNGGANGNQTGGKLWYRDVSAAGTWQSLPLVFHANEGVNQFWKATLDFDTAGIPGLNIVEYYIEVNFEEGPPESENDPMYPDTTYLYGGDLDPIPTSPQLVTTDENVARANAYSVRDRPAYIFHVDNRIISGNDVTFFAKVGYINDVENLYTRWADNGAVYYTTDGSDPEGSLGVAGNGSTQVATFQYTNAELNNIENGSTTGARAMFWEATVSELLAPPLEIGAIIKYKVGFWNSTNMEEKFGDHNAGPENRIYQLMNGNVGDPVLTVGSPNGTLNANYTTTKLFVDEIANDQIPLVVTFQPGQTATQVEIVTNLNQRDHADVDKNLNGRPDGMEFNQTEGIIGTDSDHYYRSYDITGSASAGTYTLNIDAAKTGAYRLTARWKVSGDPAWRWYTFHDSNRRDHAITVSPVDARDLRIYEINTLTIEAKDTYNNGSFIDRSTFEDLWDADGVTSTFTAGRTADNRGFNLDYLTGLGVNCLWFQPIHPPAIEGREIEPGTSNPYNPGSPYAVKNFFEVNPWMSAGFNGTDISGDTARGQAMTSFSEFTAAADEQDVDIMLDAPFNHTGFDFEVGPYGSLFERHGDPLSNHAGEKTEFWDYDTRFFSRAGNYGERATLSPGESYAAAPDRGDFGKWNDVKDVYFGIYDALVPLNPQDNAKYLSDGDRFNFAAVGQGSSTNPESASWNSEDFYQGLGNTDPKNVTRQVWKYFASYAPYWLGKTRPPGQNRNSTSSDGDAAARYAWDNAGIDGLRCDFGQGLPPQCWEYIINVARGYKWNLVMMSESLDGGAVTYRSNRHFDILNENIVFPLKVAGNSPEYRAIFDNRRSAYGQGLVLLNNTSHDEENYDNIWHALMRYNVCSTVDGAPMVFMGQELGVSRLSGFSFYETNFGKQVAHFKKFNSMQPGWLKRLPVEQGGLGSPYGEEFLWDAFSAVGQARGFSPALRNSNRYYLNRKSDGQPKNEIWAVAKYEQPNTSPNLNDVVFAFANLRTEQTQADTFNLDVSANGSNLFGIKPDRTYNVRNIAAFTKFDPNRRNYWIWPDQDAGPAEGIRGDSLIANGVYVSLNPLPADPAGWVSSPYETAFLKLSDVTLPPPPAAPSADLALFGTVVGNEVTFVWNAANDPDGGVSGYYLQIGTTPGGHDLFDAPSTATSQSISAPYGTTLYARVQQINNAGTYGPYSSASASVLTLNPSLDDDGDGQSNGSEHTAGTNPLSATSVLKATATSISGNDVLVTVATVSGKTYQLETSTALAPLSWSEVGDPVTAEGPTTVFTGTGGASDPKRFYRVRVSP